MTPGKGGPQCTSPRGPSRAIVLRNRSKALPLSAQAKAFNREHLDITFDQGANVLAIQVCSKITKRQNDILSCTIIQLVYTLPSPFVVRSEEDQREAHITAFLDLLDDCSAAAGLLMKDDGLEVYCGEETGYGMLCTVCHDRER